MINALAIDRVAFTIFGNDVYWYGIIIAASIIIEFILCCILGKKKGYKDDVFIDLCFIIILTGVFGARILYVLNNLSSFENDFLGVFRFWEGGLAILGAFITAAPCVVFYCYKKKINVWELLDIIVPGLALAQAIGRWGNFINQELYGPIVEEASLQFFPFAVFIDATQNWHMATFFYESLWNFITFAVLMITYMSKKHRAGNTFLLYIVSYSIIRIILDAIKLDGTLANQLISLAMLILVIIIHIIRCKYRKDTVFAEKFRKKINPVFLSDYIPECRQPKNNIPTDNINSQDSNQ